MSTTRSSVAGLLERQHATALRGLPADVYDYCAAGAGDEVATAEALAAWRAYRFRPRVLQDVGKLELATRLLGTELASPLGISPMAFHRLLHPAGESATAAGCAQVGALFILSTRSSVAIEDVAASTPGPWWFQVYVMKDRQLTVPWWSAPRAPVPLRSC